MFLTKSEISKQAKVEINIETLQSSCGLCKLDKDCLTPRMEVSGLGKRKILIIGDTPSQADDKNKIQFSGDTGKYLSDLLYRNGIHLQKDCWKVNAVRCHNYLKELNKPASLCSGYIKNLLHTLKPEYVIVLGSPGIAAIFGDDFSNREVERWRGFQFFDYTYNTHFFCTYHPREVVSNQKNFLLKSLFERDIKKACLISKSITKFKPIDYESKVEHLLTFKRVTEVLKVILRTKKRIYIDYETSGLKPFRKGHFIASIAFALSSNKAYAFPFAFNNFWTDKEFDEIKRLWCKILLDPLIKKMAHNIKYEEVFSSVILKTPILGWEWDSMLAAHVIDNRSEWTNLKFQTFIHFGVRPYNKFMDEFMDSKGKEFNTIHKAPLKDLLTYNGLDCIFGYKLSEKQKAEISNKPGLLNANNLLFQGTLTMSRIQRNGILMDEPYYENKKKQLTFKIKQLRRELTNGREAKKFLEKFGRPINLASGPDLGKLFYEVLGKTPVYTGKTNAKGEQNYKTDAKTLEKLNLPYVDKLIQMKKLVKARDTYFAQFAREIQNGVMYPFFDLHIPVTYRSSSSKPNFQNLPKRDENIKKAVRAGIIPRIKHVLSEIDFSGAEVITSSSYHKDPTFIAYLKDKSTDMHRDQALDIWQLDRSELVNKKFTREQQARAKKIRFYAKNLWTFAQFYGDWYDSCVRNLWETCIEREKLVLPSGVKLIDHCHSKGIFTMEDLIEHCQGVERKLWDVKFPEYTRWKKNITNFYKKNGYIETFFGFRFIGLMDRKQCTNFPIQGTSFHLLLHTLIEVEKFIKKHNLKTKIVGQIHDSIISDVPIDEIEFYHRGVSAIISKLHKTFKWLAVEMEAECAITKPREDGGNFSDLYAIKPELLDGTADFDLEKIYGKAA